MHYIFSNLLKPYFIFQPTCNKKCSLLKNIIFLYNRFFLKTYMNVLSIELQSLIMVFAHLVNHQIEPVLDFLSGVPGPTGQSALEFVLDIWCQCHGLFYGAYEKKVR